MGGCAVKPQITATRNRKRTTHVRGEGKQAKACVLRKAGPNAKGGEQTPTQSITLVLPARK